MSFAKQIGKCNAASWLTWDCVYWIVFDNCAVESRSCYVFCLGLIWILPALLFTQFIFKTIKYLEFLQFYFSLAISFVVYTFIFEIETHNLNKYSSKRKLPGNKCTLKYVIISYSFGAIFRRNKPKNVQENYVCNNFNQAMSFFGFFSSENHAKTIKESDFDVEWREMTWKDVKWREWREMTWIDGLRCTFFYR